MHTLCWWDQDNKCPTAKIERIVNRNRQKVDEGKDVSNRLRVFHLRNIIIFKSHYNLNHFSNILFLMQLNNIHLNCQSNRFCLNYLIACESERHWWSIKLSNSFARAGILENFNKMNSSNLCMNVHFPWFYKRIRTKNKIQHTCANYYYHYFIWKKVLCLDS